MVKTTRRGFLKYSSATFASATLLRAGRLMASPFGLPIGLQLYSVREMLPKDFAGTLKKIGEVGYREVEAAGYFGHSAAEVKDAMKAAGLHCVSAHYSYNDLKRDFEKILDFNNEIGVKYIICSFPGKDPAGKSDSGPNKERTFTLGDWRWNAGQFNELGKRVKAAGMTFGYHNHTMEFATQEGVVPFDELIRLTDPELVTIEMDCGWVIVGGGNPVEYLHKYPNRISLLHVKDFKRSDKPVTPTAPPVPSELGQGTADYASIFQAANKSSIAHYFVEQEAFDMPPWESLKVDLEYMRKLNV